jgi:hypothetical protein
MAEILCEQEDSLYYQLSSYDLIFWSVKGSLKRNNES